MPSQERPRHHQPHQGALQPDGPPSLSQVGERPSPFPGLFRHQMQTVLEGGEPPRGGFAAPEKEPFIPAGALGNSLPARLSLVPEPGPHPTLALTELITCQAKEPPHPPPRVLIRDWSLRDQRGWEEGLGGRPLGVGLHTETAAPCSIPWAGRGLGQGCCSGPEGRGGILVSGPGSAVRTSAAEGDKDSPPFHAPGP